MSQKSLINVLELFVVGNKVLFVPSFKEAFTYRQVLLYFVKTAQTGFLVTPICHHPWVVWKSAMGRVRWIFCSRVPGQSIIYKVYKVHPVFSQVFLIMPSVCVSLDRACVFLSQC